jgi:hypothetical protein
MTTVFAFPSAIQAAVVIGARRILSAEGKKGWLPESAEEVCAFFGTSPTQAYEMLERLKELAPTLRHAPGRPAIQAASEDVQAVLLDLRDFLMDHPGAVFPRGSRRIYRDDFRRFVVSLRDPDGPGGRMSLETFSSLTGVPLGTLKDWFRSQPREKDGAKETGTAGEETGSQAGESPASGASPEPAPLSPDPRVTTVFAEYPAFSTRPLGEFVRHLQEVHRIPWTKNQISTLLAAAGLRAQSPRKKPGEAPWAEGTYKRDLYPGAQWLGDGKKVTLELDGVRYDFNLEGILDVGSDAMLAVQITTVEDAAAVREAFHQATAESGEAPLGLCLDNRPSNHTQKLVDELAPTEVIRTTPGHPQSKAPLEGAFGLLAQTVPPLKVSGGSPVELARSILQLVLIIWAWTRNHRPRPRFGGRTPAGIYRQAGPPGPEEIQAALAHLAKLRERAERARKTLEARADPIRRKLLEEELRRLEIPDPEDRLAMRLSRYSREAICRGIAIFAARRKDRTLPPGADHGLYLGGIIRRVGQELETLEISRQLVRLRIRSQELTRAFLQVRARRIEEGALGPRLPSMLLKEALTARTELDFDFWLRELKRALGHLSPHLRRTLHEGLVRRIAVTYDLAPSWKMDLLEMLARFSAQDLAA